MVRPRPTVTASVGVTTVTQWRMTASPTTVNILVDRGSTCVIPRYPLKGSPNYPPALSAMVSRSKYVLISRTVLGPTPYAARRSSTLSEYKAF